MRMRLYDDDADYQPWINSFSTRSQQHRRDLDRSNDVYLDEKLRRTHHNIESDVNRSQNPHADENKSR